MIQPTSEHMLLVVLIHEVADAICQCTLGTNVGTMLGDDSCKLHTPAAAMSICSVIFAKAD